MSKKLAFGMTAVAALLMAALFAAVPSNFVPEWTFQGSSLKGWHVLGQADWRAEKGELIGTPKSASGGWLVLDRSYQDIGFFASFRCAGSCRTGVLLRAQKTETGMKGIYVSLTQGDLASYRVTLDAQGQELSREPLRPAGGQLRYAPDPKTAKPAVPSAAPGRVPGDRGPVFNPEEWNTIQLILDVDLLRPMLGLAGVVPPFGGGLPGGATEDMAGYGPVALYIGGSGEVRFKDVAFKDLFTSRSPWKGFRATSGCSASATSTTPGAPPLPTSIMMASWMWWRVPFYYLGPDFTQRREFMASRTYNVSTEYASDMVDFAHDFTGDGWPDILVTRGRPLWLYVNPKGESRRWDSYLAVPNVSTEIVVLHDVDGDGMPDLLYGGRNGIEFASPDRANPTATWKVTNVSGETSINIHGIGAGDINGDGRKDVLVPSGWYEQPPKGTPPGPWKFHAQDFGHGSAEICVYDVNGDGLNDVVTALSAHLYGIAWFEQKRAVGGGISFVQHPIMGDLSTKSAGNVVFSEPHATIISDLDGDGVPDFLVGKRHFSHTESYLDPDPYGPAVLYWYRTVRNPKAAGGAEFVPELIHNRSGVGSHFAAVDLNKDGAPDIITSGNRGTFIFFNRLRASASQASGKEVVRDVNRPARWISKARSGKIDKGGGVMKRREFLIGSAMAMAAGSARGQRADPAKLSRIGVMSLCFDPFLKSAARPSDPKQTVDILDFADMVADRYGIHWVEFQHTDFDSTEPKYFQEFRGPGEKGEVADQSNQPGVRKSAHFDPGSAAPAGNHRPRQEMDRPRCGAWLSTGHDEPGHSCAQGKAIRDRDAEDDQRLRKFAEGLRDL